LLQSEYVDGSLNSIQGTTQFAMHYLIKRFVFVLAAGLSRIGLGFRPTRQNNVKLASDLLKIA
jgi:hypothetical protein